MYAVVFNEMKVPLNVFIYLPSLQCVGEKMTYQVIKQEVEFVTERDRKKRQ